MEKGPLDEGYFFKWWKIALQLYVGFCHTTTLISQINVYVGICMYEPPSPLPSPPKVITGCQAGLLVLLLSQLVIPSPPPAVSTTLFSTGFISAIFLDSVYMC